MRVCVYSLYVYTHILLVLFLCRTIIQSLVLRVALEEQNLKDEFSELVMGFLELVPYSD